MNIHQNHPLIQREQTYFLDKKHISIHSEDRDIGIWKKSNEFEIMLPENLRNVVSLRLSDINLPQNFYNISNNYQNTKFYIQVIPNIAGVSTEKTALTNFNSTIEKYLITLDDGYYTPELLVNEIKNKLSNTIASELKKIPSGSSLPTTYKYLNFDVLYNSSTHKIEIVNNRDNFILHFADQIPYVIDCGYKNVWRKHIKWGLPYFLGYDKLTYNANATLEEYRIDSINYSILDSGTSNSGNVYHITSPNMLDLNCDNVIYMELDKYNSIDEIAPNDSNTFIDETGASFQSRTACNILNKCPGASTTIRATNTSYAGKVNSAFAKIPLPETNFKNKVYSKCDNLYDITIFKVPLRSIAKFKFKLRFHDGRLVDFRNQNFNFTIQACQLIDEQERFKIINNSYYD